MPENYFHMFDFEIAHSKYLDKLANSFMGEEPEEKDGDLNDSDYWHDQQENV